MQDKIDKELFFLETLLHGTINLLNKADRQITNIRKILPQTS